MKGSRLLYVATLTGYVRYLSHAHEYKLFAFRPLKIFQLKRTNVVIAMLTVVMTTGNVVTTTATQTIPTRA